MTKVGKTELKNDINLNTHIITTQGKKSNIAKLQEFPICTSSLLTGVNYYIAFNWNHIIAFS